MFDHETKKFSTDNKELLLDPILAEIHDFNVDKENEINITLAKEGLDPIKSFFNPTSNIPSNEREDTSTIESETSILTQLDLHNDTLVKSNIESDIKSNIQTFYRETYTQNLKKSLINRGISKEKMTETLELVITGIAEKLIADFKDKMKQTSTDKELPEKDFDEFWQWRITNPPNSKPLLIQGEDKNYIQYDNFASKKAIEQFISQNNSSTNIKETDGIFTTDAIETALEEIIGEFKE
jgi:hypothetical protein